jgi:hypothetical protein
MKANVAAVQLVVQKRPGEFTAAELQVLLGYSGDGGLSIEQIRDQYPPELQPETFGLIHAYPTPTVLADALGDMVCGLLPGLVGRDGYIRALEPSAGNGRLVRSVNGTALPGASGERPDQGREVDDGRALARE